MKLSNLKTPIYPVLFATTFLLSGCGSSENSTENVLITETPPASDNTSSDATDSNSSSSTDSDNNASSDNDTDTHTDNGTASVNGSTDGVLCNYYYNEYNDSDSVQATSNAQWSCDGSNRSLTANGLPDHATGQFPNANNPNEISEQNVSITYTLTPNESTTASTLGGPRGATGYVLNGVKIDANTAGTCDDLGNNCSLIGNEGNWHIEALGQTSFNFGTDDNNAHVQPGGAYHYHGMPEGFITLRGGDNTSMTLIGWAADGFPIYARYGFSEADNASSPIKIITGSYQLIENISANRPSVEVYPLGTFAEDWEFVVGSGDLDECNGRFGVTPEFPEGIYHYYATDSYPYFQRCVKGEL